jgi:YbbR domain-containing protein
MTGGKANSSQGRLTSHFLRKVFLEDWGIKLLALAITTALWLGVTGLSTPTTRKFYNVPLNLDISADTQIVNSPPLEVTIEVSGDKRKLDEINRLGLAARLDLTEMKPGQWAVSLSPQNVIVPLERGVTLIDIAPGRIPVNLEAVEEKEIDVIAETSGELPAGLEVYSTTIAPAKIRVRGPASVMRMLDYVQTDKIDLSDKRGDFSVRQVAVSASNPQAVVLSTVADVSFRIGERRMERSFTLPIAGEPGRSASFVLYGPRSLMQKVKADAIKVEIYLDGNGELRPRLILPTEIENVAEVKDLRMN